MAHGGAVLTGPQAPAGTGRILLARIRGTLGELVTPGQISTITYTVTDLTNGVQLGTGTFTVADTVFADLQQSNLSWDADGENAPGGDGLWGYNFAAVVPASLFPVSAVSVPRTSMQTTRPRKIRCDVAFTPVSGDAFRLCYEWEVVDVYG